MNRGYFFSYMIAEWTTYSPASHAIGNQDAAIPVPGLHLGVRHAPHGDGVGRRETIRAHDNVEKVGDDQPQVDGFGHGLSVQRCYNGRSARGLRRKGGHSDRGKVAHNKVVEGLGRNVGNRVAVGENKRRERGQDDRHGERDGAQGGHVAQAGAVRRRAPAPDFAVRSRAKAEYASIASHNTRVAAPCENLHRGAAARIAEQDEALRREHRAAVARYVDHIVSPKGTARRGTETDRRTRREQNYERDLGKE